MRPYLFALIVLLPNAAKAQSVAEKADQLYALSARQGLVSVAAMPGHDDVDKDILRLMAAVTGDTFAAILLDSNSTSVARADVAAVRGGRMLSPPRLRRAMAEDRAYSVVFSNETTTDLDEVVVFWQKHGAPFVEPPLKQRPFPSGLIYSFALGACPQMRQYAIGVFVNRQMVMKIPDCSGCNITPEIASQFHPDDRDPCSDSWVLFEQ